MPKNETNIIIFLLSYYEQKKEEMIHTLNDSVASDVHCNLSFDECTCGVNGEVLNLGLLYTRK